jgi:hypothetical protein
MRPGVSFSQTYDDDKGRSQKVSLKGEPFKWHGERRKMQKSELAQLQTSMNESFYKERMNSLRRS